MAGGLSGRPLRDLSTRLIEDMYVLTKGQVSHTMQSPLGAGGAEGEYSTKDGVVMCIFI